MNMMQLMQRMHGVQPVKRKIATEISAEIPIGITDGGGLLLLPTGYSSNQPVISINGPRGCLPYYEKIYAMHPKIISEMQDSDTVVSMNFITQEISKNNDFLVNSGKKKIFEVKTGSGRIIHASGNHNFVTKKEIKRLDRLKLGDMLPVLKKLPSEEKIDSIPMGKNEVGLDWDFGYLIGVYLAEGDCAASNKYPRRIKGKTYYGRGGTRVSFTVVDDLIANKLMDVLDKLHVSYRKVYRKTYDVIYSISTKGSREFQDFLVGNFSTGALAKKIPEWVFVANDDFKRGMLSGFFSGDGTVKIRGDNDKPRVSFGVVSRELRDSISTLLLQFGIFHRLFEEDKSKQNKKWNRSYCCEVYSGFLKTFYNNVKMIESVKQGKLDARLKKMGFRNEKINEAIMLLTRNYYYKAELARRTGLCFGTMTNILKRLQEFVESKTDVVYAHMPSECANCTSQNIIKYGRQYNLQKFQCKDCKKYFSERKIKRKLYKLANFNPDIFWDKVAGIKYVGEEESYDLQVPNDNTFALANGVIVHNSGKTSLLQRLLDCAFHYAGFNCVILNDVRAESYAWVLKNDDPDLLDIIYSSGLNETPMSLPIQTVAPAYSLLEPTKLSRHMFSPKLDEIKSSEAWNCIIKFEEAPSTKYLFDSICIQLAEASSLDEIRDTIMGDPDLRQDIKRAIMVRVRTFLTHPKPFPIINSPNVNFEGKQIPSLKIILNIIERGWIPSIVTYYCGAYLNDYLRFYVAATLDMLFKRQFDAIHFPDKFPRFYKPLWLFVPELTQIANTGARAHGAVLKLNQWATQGRQAMCGMVTDSQDYSKMTTTIRNECNYVFAFQTRGKNNISALASDLSLPLKVEKTLGMLRQFEFIAIAKDAPLVLLQPNGKRIFTNKPIRATAIPSLSRHLKAGESLEM